MVDVVDFMDAVDSLQRMVVTGRTGHAVPSPPGERVRVRWSPMVPFLRSFAWFAGYLAFDVESWMPVKSVI